MKTVPDSFTPNTHPAKTTEETKQNQDLKGIWEEILNKLPKKIKQRSIETWLRPCKLHEITDTEIVISVRNEFSRKLIAQSYSEDIFKASTEVFAAAYSIRFITRSDNDFEPNEV
ncbi:MAG: DnaA N-terminal domain-containing protein, partial [bacterium]